MVIFCTNAEEDIRFRDPNLSDTLKSESRYQFLLPKHEVDFSIFAEHENYNELLRTNNTENLLPWQQKSSLGHWSLMRTVFPPAIWEMW